MQRRGFHRASRGDERDHGRDDSLVGFAGSSARRVDA
jgi:hypothetical protein